MFFSQHQPHTDCSRMHAPILVIELVKMLFALALACGKDAEGSLKLKRDISLYLSLHSLQSRLFDSTKNK